MILSDADIIKEQNKSFASGIPFIDPFVDHLVREGVSYGLSSYGYDARLANEFLLLKSSSSDFILDPASFPSERFERIVAGSIIVPPHGFVLARTFEHFSIPRDVMGICLGKSTYARCGILLNTTPLEPCWSGYVTLEISNLTSVPVRIYANQGIVQVIFLRGSSECLVSYKDRKGKYDGQKDITPPRVICQCENLTL